MSVFVDKHELAERKDVTTLQEKVTSQETEIAKKANSAEVYTKSELDPKLADKADKSDVTTLTSRISALEKKIEGH